MQPGGFGELVDRVPWSMDTDPDEIEVDGRNSTGCPSSGRYPIPSASQ
jgi:hypothetical protein